MNERAIVFSCSGDELLGILHEPDGSNSLPSARAVLVIVGGPQYRVGSHRQFVLMARYLAGAGYPVFRFDYRGMGDSEGTARTFEQTGADVRAAIDVLFREVPGLRSIGVFGLCDAASAALMFAAPDPRVDALLIANPWVRTSAGEAKTIVRYYYAERLLQREFWTKLLTGGLNPWRAIRGALSLFRQSRDASQAEPGYIAQMLNGLQAFRGRVLLLLSGNDLTAREFDQLCRSDDSWAAAVGSPATRRVDIPDTDHTFSDRQGLIAANAAIEAFLLSLS